MRNMALYLCGYARHALPVLVGALLIGCAADLPNQAPTAAASQAPAPDAIPDSIARAGATRLIPGDPARLPTDIERVIYDQLHWGVLSIEPSPRRMHGQAAPEPEAVTARALLPDGRTATIHAASHDYERVAVGVLVGRLGDAALENAFLDHLADALAAEPTSPRGWGFKLPPTETTPEP